MTTIPGSSMSATTIRWWRIAYDVEVHRAYRAKVPDGFLVAIVSRDDAGETCPLWHISISHRDAADVPDRCPTWDEMKSAKYQLVPKDIAMVLVFPRANVPYVDVHPTCLHLWESTEKRIDE